MPDQPYAEQYLLDEVRKKILASSSYTIDIHIGVFKDDWHYHFGTHELPMHVQRILDDSLRKKVIR